MMGGTTPETCWAVNKRQDNKVENCCIRLVIYLNCTMMHGLTKLKIMIISRWILLRIRIVSDKSCRENQKTRFVFRKVFPPQHSYRIGNNVGKYGTAGRPQMTVRRMRIACWMTKAADTHSECLTLGRAYRYPPDVAFYIFFQQM